MDDWKQYHAPYVAISYDRLAPWADAWAALPMRLTVVEQVGADVLVRRDLRTRPVISGAILALGSTLN